MLTEARSGSNWLGSLANSTGVMGVSKEWLNYLILSEERVKSPVDAVLQKAGTENGRFGVKIFPGQLHAVQSLYGMDFIDECLKRHQTALIFMQRRDRIRQAISYERARTTAKWRSVQEEEREPVYDFENILRWHFLIERGYAFWRSYLEIRQLKFAEFVYEDLLHDVKPYLAYLETVLDVKPATPPLTGIAIQRDALTEEWVERFRQDLIGKNVVALTQPPQAPAPARTMINLARFLTKKLVPPLQREFL